MKRIIFIFIVVFMLPRLGAQDLYDQVLAEIEANSLTLSTLREQLKAEILDINTDRFLANPEVELGYLWGEPSSIGNRIDYSVTQSIDFPSVYSHKSNIARQEEINAELYYRAERATVLLNARESLVELIFRNALAAEYSVRVANAEAVAALYRKKMDSGASSVIEYNKAAVNLATIIRDAENNELERMAVLSKLKALNGDKEITFDDTKFIKSELPENFDDWFAELESRNPQLLRAVGVAGVAESAVKLEKANSLPKLSAGFMSENIVGETYQGVTVGLSVPMWENKNSVKSAMASANASRLAAADTRIMLYNSLKNVYEKTKSLREMAESYRRSVEGSDNRVLLEKSLETGALSLIDYLVELRFYYDAVDNMLATERDGEMAASRLWAETL